MKNNMWSHQKYILQQKKKQLLDWTSILLLFLAKKKKERILKYSIETSEKDITVLQNNVNK